MPVKGNVHVPQVIISARAYSKNIRGTAPNIIHSDNAQEYVAESIFAADRQFGTRSTTTILYNPEENGIAERAIRKIVNGVRCSLATSNIDEAYWPE